MIKRPPSGETQGKFLHPCMVCSLRPLQCQSKQSPRSITCRGCKVERSGSSYETKWYPTSLPIQWFLKTVSGRSQQLLQEWETVAFIGCAWQNAEWLLAATATSSICSACLQQLSLPEPLLWLFCMIPSHQALVWPKFGAHRCRPIEKDWKMVVDAHSQNPDL